MRKPTSFSLAQRIDGTSSTAVTYVRSLLSARPAVKDIVRTVTPSLFVIFFAIAAHAQGGSIDFTPVQTVGTSVVTIVKYIGGAVTVCSLIYSAFEFFGRHDVSKALSGVVGAIGGGVIIGAAVAWGASTTGQTVQ